MFWVVALFLLASCGVRVHNKAEILTGNNINNTTKEAIRKQVNGIYKSIQRQDARYIAQLFPEGGSTVDTINEILSSINITREPGRINSVGEFYIKNDSRLSINSVSSSIGGNEYVYFFTPHTTETYVYLFYSPARDELSDVLVSLEFSKGDNKWFLTHINFGTFLYHNLPAPKLVYEAYSAYLKNDLLPAAIDLSVTNMLTFPAGDKFHYMQEKEIVRLMTDIAKEVNERFAYPREIGIINSKPVILDLQADRSSGDFFAKVVYISAQFENGIAALQRENDELHLLREQVFPGISKYGDKVIYRVLSDTSSDARVNTYERDNSEEYMTDEQYIANYMHAILQDSIKRKGGSRKLN